MVVAIDAGVVMTQVCMYIPEDSRHKPMDLFQRAFLVDIFLGGYIWGVIIGVRMLQINRATIVTIELNQGYKS